MNFTSGDIMLIVFGALALAVLLGYAISIYNNLIEVRNNTEKAFKNIDVLLQQRHDELPKLVEACQGYMKHEAGILLELTRLREQYRQANTTDQKAVVENQLNKALGGLSARWEAYPELKANENFRHLQERISGLEASIAGRREFFNDSVNVFNIQIERFPDLLVAMLLRYAKRNYLEIPVAQKADVAVQF